MSEIRRLGWGFGVVSAVVLVTACGSGARALEAPGPSGAPIWSGVFTSAEADGGAAIYARSCARCHGRQLQGAEDAPPLSGNAFLRWWYGRTLAELESVIRTTMPLDNPAGLTQGQYFELLAYILRANGYPAGTRGLSADATQLNLIPIEPDPAGATGPSPGRSGR